MHHPVFTLSKNQPTNYQFFFLELLLDKPGRANKEKKEIISGVKKVTSKGDKGKEKGVR
jgi:hypothetical protein